MLDSPDTIESDDFGKTYTVPESRIGSAADARGIIAKMEKGELNTRSPNRAKVNGIINGNRPWNPDKLKGKAQADRANFNTREAEGFVAAAKTPYYGLVYGVDQVATFEIDYGADPLIETEWGNKVGKRYHDTLDLWDGMDMRIQRSQYQMVVHGHGPMAWEDEDDWQSNSLVAGQLLLPDDASADIEEWETAALPRSYTPSRLWKLIQNESAATAAKWNVPACKDAIMNASKDDATKNYGHEWEFYEAELRKGAVGYDNKSKKIFVHDLWQKEFNGKISHFIVLRTSPQAPNSLADKDSSDKSAGFLYRKLNRYDCFSQIICPFLYDVGPDGQWHSIKGAGPKIHDICDVSNKLTCKMIDGANAASGLILQATTAKALQETAVAHISGGVVLHPDITVHQNRIADNLQSPMLVKRDLQNTLQSNTGSYRQRVSDENHEPTLGQAQLNAQQQATLGGGDISRYYRSLDRWHRETFRRLIAMGKKLYSPKKDQSPLDYSSTSLPQNKQLALEFYRGCIQDQIPEEVLQYKYFCRIKATRSVGGGSAQLRVMMADKLLTALPRMDERSANAALRMWSAAVTGEQTVADILFPAYDSTEKADDHQWSATMENNMLRQPGGEVLVTPTQDDVIHIQNHLKDVATHAQALQQGQDQPMNLLVHLEQAGPHIHEHLQKLAGDPTRKEQYDQFNKAWLGMSKMTDQLSQQIQEAQKAQQANQPQQQPDPALVAALAKVHGELQLKAAKQQGDMQLKTEKQQQQMRLKDVSQAHGMRLDNIELLHSQNQTMTTNNSIPEEPEPSTAAKISESIAYKDARPFIQQQMERQAGLDPGPPVPRVPPSPPSKPMPSKVPAGV